MCGRWRIQAVRDGIVDRQRGLYVDPTTQETSAIAEAMSDGRIIVERVSTTKSAAKTQSIGIITVRTLTDTREYSIGAAVDTTSDKTVSADEVRRHYITLELFRGVLLKVARSRPDAARVGRDSNPCRIILIPSATAGLSVVTVGWLLELSLKIHLKCVA